MQQILFLDFVSSMLRSRISSGRGFPYGDYEFIMDTKLSLGCVPSLMKSIRRSGKGELVDEVYRLRDEIYAHPLSIWLFRAVSRSYIKYRLEDFGGVSDLNHRRATYIAGGPLVEVPLETLPEDKRDCAICREEYCEVNEDGERHMPAKLPCGHVYGHNCAAIWFGGAGSCPFRCKFEERTRDQTPDVTTLLNEIEWASTGQNWFRRNHPGYRIY